MALQKKKHWLSLVLGCGILALTACNSIQQEETGGGGGGGGGTKSLAVSLSSATLVSGTRATVTATLTDSVDGAVSGANVCFTPGTLGSVVGATCATTNASGVATTQLEAGATSGNATVTATGSGATGTANYAVDGPTLTMSNAVLNVTASNSPTATATVVDGSGAPVAGAVVSFAVGNTTFATLNPVSGTVLTDASGVASITLSPGSASGASTLTASAEVAVSSTTTSQIIGTASLSGQVNFQATTSSTSTGSIKLSTLTTGVNTLSAYGTTLVTVNVLDQNDVLYTTPVTVNFSSNCVSQGKATLAASVLTINGTATASFVDKGCGNTDQIQATLAGITATPAIKSLAITAPTIGSIQFVSASPSNISLKGTGGAGRQESSVVTFKVVDQANNAKSATVTFSLSTSVGGILMPNTTAESDAVTGLVSTIVQAGTIPTPVRVTATVTQGSTTLTTQSDQLTISTGLPDQAHFSISASPLNLEGARYDGVESKVTVRLADHFGNPVPDKTAVSFIAEGGSIESNCVTTNGACTVTFTSQELRPTNNRITILAYAIGEETFTDWNGDGKATMDAEFVDANNQSTDMGEAFVDYDANRIRDAGEPFIDFDNNGAYTPKDNKLASTLCVTTGGFVCADSKTLHVRSQREGALPFQLVLSDSNAQLINVTATPDVGAAITPVTSLDFQCSVRSYTLSFTVASADNAANPMPKGTTITASITNGKLPGATTFVVPSSVSVTDSAFNLMVAGDDQGCGTPTGLLTLTIKTPDQQVNGNSITGTTTVRTFNLVN